jgi:antirestriction protein ArdC
MLSLIKTKGGKKMTKVSEKKNIYEIINERIFDLLEKGEIPWQKPWVSGEPVSFITKKTYRGINPFILISSGYSCPYWASFKQVKGKGGSIKKGEKGFPVVFWKWIEIDGQDTESGKINVPFLRYYTVFNLEQAEGIDIPKMEQRNFHPISEAERIIHQMPKAPVIEQKEPQAYYLPSEDLVNMPNSNLFKSDEEYYSTLFHELTHSTGHPSRLNRSELSKINMLKSHDYSKEELVAEMGSAFLCGRCGIAPKVIDNQAAYIKAWLTQLQNNRKWLVYAAAKAQKAADFILGIDHEEHEKDAPPMVSDLEPNQPNLN